MFASTIHIYAFRTKLKIQKYEKKKKLKKLTVVGARNIAEGTTIT